MRPVGVVVSMSQKWKILLSELLAKQMVLALERADAPNTRSVIERAQRDVKFVHSDQGIRRSTRTLREGWVLKTGAVFAGVTLLFFMALVFLSIKGFEVPAGDRYLLVIVLAFAGALSFWLHRR